MLICLLLALTLHLSLNHVLTQTRNHQEIKSSFGHVGKFWIHPKFQEETESWRRSHLPKIRSKQANLKSSASNWKLYILLLSCPKHLLGVLGSYRECLCFWCQFLLRLSTRIMSEVPTKNPEHRTVVQPEK